jgi:hypothetical protein
VPNLSQRQVIAIVVLTLWLCILGLSLLGGPWLSLPGPVTTAAGLTAIIPLFFLIPVAALVGLLRKGSNPQRGPALVGVLRWRRFVLSGGVLVLIGTLLLIPSSYQTSATAAAGAIGLGLGVVNLAVGLLGFRARSGRVPRP